MSRAFDVLLSSRSASVTRDLAEALSEAFHDIGCESAVVRDRLPPVRSNRATVVLAPSDVLPHLRLTDGRGLTAALARTVLICTASRGSRVWQQEIAYANSAAAVFHISKAGVQALAEAGLEAEHFQLGYHQTLDRWRGRESIRPLDVVVMALATPRRDRVLAAAAEVLADYDVEVRLPSERAALDRPSPDFVAGVEKQELLASAKILLSVHGTDDRTFDWPEAVAALCNGCVLLCEESRAVSPLEPGRHFVSGSGSSLPLLLDVLLRHPERLEQIRHEAYRLVREKLPLTSAARRVRDVSERMPGLPPPERDFSLTGQRRLGEPESESLEHDRRDLIPPAWGEVMSRQNAVLKKLFFDLRLLRRQVAYLTHAVDAPDTPLIETTKTRVVGLVRPDVSVIVSVHNYRRFIREALSSVARSRGVIWEAVVIDDASIDDSGAEVRDFMDEHPTLPITLIEQKINTGVQRARNLAVAHARAPYVFVLDADNLVYPRGLQKLRDALAGDPEAAFAYGIIERFDADGSTGLMNTGGWDPARLAREGYIDAMALIRVDAFLRVGGYVTDPMLELGWEDYDLWLSLAVAGMHGVHVREIVGRYRVHGVSSLTMTTLDTEELVARLRHRHAAFFQRTEKAAAHG